MPSILVCTSRFTPDSSFNLPHSLPVMLAQLEVGSITLEEWCIFVTVAILDGVSAWKAGASLTGSNDWQVTSFPFFVPYCHCLNCQSLQYLTHTENGESRFTPADSRSLAVVRCPFKELDCRLTLLRHKRTRLLLQSLSAFWSFVALMNHALLVSRELAHLTLPAAVGHVQVHLKRGERVAGHHTV